MTYTKAKIWLRRAIRHGYVPVHGGIACFEGDRYNKDSYGVNIDGDGHNGRYFGCPHIVWYEEEAARRFPPRKYKKRRAK